MPGTLSIGQNCPTFLVAVGLSEKFDIQLLWWYGSGLLARAKYQLLGQSRHDAEAGNFSLAVLGGLGPYWSNRTVNDETKSYSLKGFALEGNILGGY